MILEIAGESSSSSTSTRKEARHSLHKLDAVISRSCSVPRIEQEFERYQRREHQHAELDG